MTRAMSKAGLTLGLLCLTAGAALAQQTTSATQTKTFEVLAVDGNQLVVKLPEGTRELTVPDDFRFTVNGQQMSVRQLKAGMKGTATITTRTTVTPVTVTQVKSGTVMQSSGSSIIVRTDEGIKIFTQTDADKRGVKIMRDGQPAQISDFRQGDQLTATIITSKPPRVMTEKEVKATLSNATTAATSAATTGTTSARAATTAPPAQARAAQAQTSAPATGAPRTLPKTASSWPAFGLAGILLLAMGCALTIRRRLIHHGDLL